MHLAAPITFGSRPCCAGASCRSREASACLGPEIGAAFASPVSSRSRPIDVHTVAEPMTGSKPGRISRKVIPAVPAVRPRAREPARARNSRRASSAVRNAHRHLEQQVGRSGRESPSLMDDERRDIMTVELVGVRAGLLSYCSFIGAASPGKKSK